MKDLFLVEPNEKYQKSFENYALAYRKINDEHYMKDCDITDIGIGWSASEILCSSRCYKTRTSKLIPGSIKTRSTQTVDAAIPPFR